MAIEVRVPTILRSYTGGSKVVEGSGDTLSGLIDDLDAKVKDGDAVTILPAVAGGALGFAAAAALLGK